MQREYHKWFSPALARDMELLAYGHSGMPLLVFPSSMGRFFEYEDRDMIGNLSPRIESGELQVFCVDSVDRESWYNRHAHPRDRIQRHQQYENYVLWEVLPLMRSRSSDSSIGVTGCSFGGYHAVNFTLRHPDHVSTCVGMSGAFDIHRFLHGYWDDDAYFHCPPDYLSNMDDEWYLSRYRNGLRLILAAGEHDICLGENRRLSGILNRKGIPHWLDVWGDQARHDWPLWQQMARKFF